MITKYQSPYKGFNRKRHFFKMAIWKGRINPPIRGSIVCELAPKCKARCLNPPIRGSIEQDNALFKNYNHKR